MTKGAIKPLQRILQELEESGLPVAAYLRVSTDEQAKSGLGIEAQRERCKAMALVKGWPEPVFYVDAGYSGTLPIEERPRLKDLMRDLQAGKYQAVIVLSIDRLGRKALLILDLIEQISQYADFISCKESFDTSTAAGKFVVHIFAAVAQLERDLIRERVLGALKVLDEQTGERGGRMPYGYQRVDKGLEIVRGQQEIIEQVFRLNRRGKSLRQIAALLNEEGIPAPRGGAWTHSSIQEVLENEPLYLGAPRGHSQKTWPIMIKQSMRQRRTG